MPESLEFLAALALIAFSGVAAVFDWRSRRIPNALIVIGLVVALTIAAVTRGADGLMYSAAGLGIGLLLFLPGFLLRFTGGGDVKMLATLGAFLGPLMVFKVFVLTVGFGAALVIFLAILRVANSGFTGWPALIHRYRSMLSVFWATREFVYLPPAKSSVLSQRLPLAPLMASSVLVVLLQQFVAQRGF